MEYPKVFWLQDTLKLPKHKSLGAWLGLWKATIWEIFNREIEKI